MPFITEYLFSTSERLNLLLQQPLDFSVSFIKSGVKTDATGIRQTLIEEIMKAININRTEGNDPIIDDSIVLSSFDMLTTNVKINNSNGYPIHNINIKYVLLNISLY